jgi:hypothetical protein
MIKILANLFLEIVADKSDYSCLDMALKYKKTTRKLAAKLGRLIERGF